MGPTFSAMDGITGASTLRYLTWDVPETPHEIPRPATYLGQVGDIENDVSTSWGTFVRTSRTARQLNQDDLADAAGIDRKTLIRMEGGHTKGVNLAHVFAICRVLEIRPSDAVATLDPDAENIPLPPPLPPAIARLVDNFNALDLVDREGFLARVEFVNEWAELWMRQERERRSTRRSG